MKELLEGYAFSIQWFPGHMTKARREMESQLRLVDVVVEMLDARIPRSSANPLLQRLIGQKTRIVALSKTDMADPDVTQQWLAAFREEGLKALEVDCQKGRGTRALLSAIREAGQPVVDKSTLINRLLGKNKTVTQNKPGVTRQTQWVEIGRGIELLDTPGVLWPKFEQAETGFNLAVTGAIKEDIFDRETAAAILLTRLLRLYPQQLAAAYGITLEAGETARTAETKIGTARGAIKAGGELNLPKTVDLILRDFKFGRLGPMSLEKP